MPQRQLGPLYPPVLLNICRSQAALRFILLDDLLILLLEVVLITDTTATTLIGYLTQNHQVMLIFSVLYLIKSSI